MRGTTLLGVGAILIGAVGCSGDDTAPGSKIGQTKGGSGGSGGDAGSLSLGGLPNGGAGSGGGGAGGANSAGAAQAGSSAGGVANQAGSSSGGAGGAKPAGMCKRVAGSDADCLDFYPAEPPDPAKPQAYACDDTGAYLTLNTAHAGKCASVNFVTGSKYGACCPP